MGQVAAAAAVGTSLASTGFEAAGALTSAQGDKAAADYQASKAARAAAFGRVQADQTAAALTDELTNTLANIDAIRAAAGIDPTSPTSAAIRASEQETSNRERNTRVANILEQAKQHEFDAEYFRAAGDQALKAGYLKATAIGLKGISGAAKSMG